MGLANYHPTDRTHEGTLGMKLVGNYLSPYVRRVAISLNVLDIDFDLDQLFVFDKPANVRALNPVTRIPVLVLDDGTRLIESSAILDEIDQIVGPEKALISVEHQLRTRTMQIAALALACAEKAQWSFYEGRVRPAEKVHQPWIEHNDRQVVGGLEALETEAGKPDTWIAGTNRISQADITTTVAFTFAHTVRPQLDLPSRFPALNMHVEKCETLDAFKCAPLPEHRPN